jgi:beta-lactamase regulating signal transducer with metallopeptidase domain
MDFLLPLAAKSLLIAGLTLAVLRIARRRSAAERSWIAHIGLAAVLVLPLALLLPQIHVPAPAFLEQPAQVATVPAPQAAVEAKEVALPATTFPVASEAAAESSVDWAFWAYAVPAALLLLLTLTALVRLVVLKTKANVLVEPRWLSALAHAQRRMGFKHGTALLTSDDLSSPISWGLMRPVILLNSEAADANAEAEAIIAHELAHVAHLDWLKLLLARVTVSLFWFNPLVWLLAREAHQLREEAADDAVLASDIEDTEYAKLLVGIARHECRGLLIGAHGVAPARGSLARRIARVLDSNSARGPVARSFALGVFVGAACLAAPLAAVTLTPKKDEPAKADMLASAREQQPYYPNAGGPLPGVIGSAVGHAVSSAVSSALSTVTPGWSDEDQRDLEKELDRADDFEARAPSGATVTRRNGMIVSRAPSGATVTVYPPDSKGRRKIVARAPNGAVATSYADEDDVAQIVGGATVKHKDKQQRAIEEAIEMKAVGVTPEYAASIRAAAPWLKLSSNDLIEMRAVGVTPGYVREFTRGFGRVDADTITEARAVGLTGDYIRRMTAAGFRGTLDDYVEMRAVGVTPEYAESFRRRGIKILSSDQLVEMRAHDIQPDDVVGAAQPPRPPAPPRTPDDG